MAISPPPTTPNSANHDMAHGAFGKLSFRPTADQELVTDLDGLWKAFGVNPPS